MDEAWGFRAWVERHSPVRFLDDIDRPIAGPISPPWRSVSRLDQVFRVLGFGCLGSLGLFGALLLLVAVGARLDREVTNLTLTVGFFVLVVTTAAWAPPLFRRCLAVVRPPAGRPLSRYEAALDPLYDRWLDP